MSNGKIESLRVLNDVSSTNEVADSPFTFCRNRLFRSRAQSLLTLATYRVLTQHAQLVLLNKISPAAVLALIPEEVKVKIARKFPGNEDGAQEGMTCMQNEALLSFF